jgi:hypothetical protein
MAALAGLQVPPGFRRMIRCEYKPLGIPYRLVGFDFHAALVPDLVMALRAETRLVAAIAALRIILRLYRVDGDKAGPMGRGHRFSCPRQTSPQIWFDIPTLVAVETERLLMAVGAITSRLLCQQPVFLGEKGPVIVRYAGPAVAVPALIKRGALVFPVVGPGV